MSAAETPKRRRRRKWPWVVGGIVGTILLLVGGLFALLATAADRAVVVRGLLGIANDQFAGRIELRRAWLFPNGYFIAHDVTIFDPAGAVVVRAATVETHVDLPALLKKHLHLTRTAVGGAALFLVVDTRGNVNIEESFLPKHKAAVSPPKAANASTGFGFTMDIDGADVAANEVHVVLEQGAVTSISTLANLRQILVHASVSLDAAGVITVDAPSLRAEALAPLAGPLQLAASVRLKGAELEISTDATLDDAHLKAKANLDIGTLNGLATLTDSSVGPRVLGRWVAELGPRGLRGDAAVALQAGIVKLVSLQARPLKGAGELAVSGWLDVAKGDAETHLVATRLDARALLDRLPSTSLAFTVEAIGKGLYRDDRGLSAHLTVGHGAIEAQDVGPGVLDAKLKGADLALTGVDIAFPGGRVRGSGTLSGQRVSARAEIVAPELASLRAALAGICRVNLPHFAGQLTSQVEIEGPLTGPAVRAEVHALHLSLNGIVAAGLEAHLDAPRLGRQMDLQGQVAIAELNLADHALHDVGVSVAWTTPDLHLEVQAQERGRPLEVAADLLLPEDLESATVSSLELQAAGNDWVMSQPAHLDFRNGIALADVELRSDPQRLRLSLTVAPHAITGTLELEALDLSRLPALLLPSLRLSGTAVGAIHYQERPDSHLASADLELTRVSFRGLEVSTGQLKGTLDQQGATLELSAKLGHGVLSLTGTGPLPGVAGPIEVHASATGIVLDDFDGLAPKLAGIHAALSLELRLAGDWAAPQLSLTAAAAGLTGAWTPDPQGGVLAAPLELDLQATLDPKGLKQDLRLQAGHALLLTLVGSAPIPSRKLAEAFDAPSKLWAELRASPLDERLTLVDLPLEPVIHRLPWARAPNLEGTISANGYLHGTFRAPRGELTLNTRQLSYEHHPLGELELQLAANDDGFNGKAELHPPQGQVTAALDWRLAPEQVRDEKARTAARLTADLALSGLPLSIVLGEQASLSGLAELSGTFRGSLAEPSARATASLHELAFEKVAVGGLDAKASWNGTHLVATLEGQQPQGGHLAGRADVPLRLGGEPKGQPLTGTLDASGFDLAAFGALAAKGGLGSAVRAIAGRLDSKLSIAGTLAAPRPTGTLAFSHGKLALAGLGQFNELEAKLSVGAAGIDIERIAGKSAGGTFLVQGKGSRAEGSRLTVQAHIGTERLGVFASDRLVGLLSSSEDLTGSIGRERTDLTLAVHHALFTLPTLVPKSVGATSIDADIVVGSPRPAAALKAKAYAVQLHVIAPDGLELKATDLDIKARADLVLAMQGAAEMKGGVFATEGVVNAYGRHFKLQHANVTFGRGEDFGRADNPYIDARATQTIGRYRLFLDVSGHPTTIEVSSSTEPPLDKERVGELLVTGSAEGLGTQGGSLAAASALGGIVSERLRDWLGPYMPLDVLTVDPNHLEAGKHITSRLYVGAIENLGVTDPRVNGAEVHANYKLTDQWGLDSRYGTAQAGALDLQWTRSW